MNGLQSLKQWNSYFGNPTGTRLGVVNAAQSIGSVLSILLIGSLSDRFGRRPMLLTGIILIITSTIIQSASVNYAMFVISRVIVGLGGMFVVQPSPMLIAELAYPTHRGKYTCAFWTMYYLGAILASWTTFGTQGFNGTWSWRIPSIVQAGLPLVQVAFWWAVPESPRWLIANDRADEASIILSKYHSGRDVTAEGAEQHSYTPLVELEISEMVQKLQAEKDAARTTSWGSLAETPGNRRRTLIAVCVGVFAQWNGIGVVSYYLTLVLDSVGITDTFDQTLINGLLQIFNFCAALTAAALVDRLGRRTLFLWSSVGMLASYIVWTACSAVSSDTGSRPAGVAVVVCLFVYYFHYDIAWTPLLLGYPTEILPYSLRSKGIALGLFSIYASLIVAAFCNPLGMENLGWKYYIVFCALLVVFLAVVWVLFPETRGHSLEEIAVIFDGKQTALVEEVPSKKEFSLAHLEKTTSSKTY